MQSDADVRLAPGGISLSISTFVLLTPILVFAVPVDAAVVISSGTTSNMSCSVGVCAPTAADAVLNVDDLESMLVAGNVEVTTSGSGVQADDIGVSDALSWSSANVLTLDAYDSIAIWKPVSLTGLSGLTLTTGDGGSGGMLSFGEKGHVTIKKLSSLLVINGTTYSLVGTIASLASAISQGAGGNYALANDFDASRDGTYSTSPIGTTFTGVFEGLGNKIESLTIKDDHQESAALFLQSNGFIRDVGLVNESVTSLSTDVQAAMAGLVAGNDGTVTQSYNTGSITTNVRSGGPSDGGLVGGNTGSITLSYSTATVTGNEYGSVGGLAAENMGSIAQSFATGDVTGGGVGGLVGFNAGTINNSFALGATSGAANASAGGLVGYNYPGATIGQSYATGEVTGAVAGYKGGVIGYDDSASGSNSDCYWNTKTSHIPIGEGAGHPTNDPGLAGFTSKQLRSGLPNGFDPTVWAERHRINSGFPYLLAEPPPKQAATQLVKKHMQGGAAQ